jgi:cytochrome c
LVLRWLISPKNIKKADVDMLADKIIKGGSGNWGTVPMTAHADLPVADAKEMVNIFYQ